MNINEHPRDINLVLNANSSNTNTMLNVHPRDINFILNVHSSDISKHHIKALGFRKQVPAVFFFPLL